ncbi:sensor histidine kinase [Desulfosporosinus fructosivorans]|uniref:sensor histidine kinase n=1 Tax=Desulfosporosinus fructosivorans TaxID=2018669 RepID=UPI001A7EDA2E|nr:HAMP domain-containing sensor histidine kinase [Desulfosporosinus fructosivorans]
MPDALLYSKVLTMQEGSVNILAEEPVPAIGAFVSPEQTIILEVPRQTKPTSDFLGMNIKGVPGVLKMPDVGHIVISDAIPLSSSLPLPDKFLQAVQEDAQKQQVNVLQYSHQIDDKTLFYVIRKDEIMQQPRYIVSFAWGNYPNNLAMSLFWRLLLLMLISLLLSWPVSLFLARYISRPLVLMETQAARIAERDWFEPFVLDRRDEIGKLGRAFENMRQRLVKQDKTQQSFLQNISHELKTPVMVIRSYAQSMLDGIYPKGTLDESILVINGEAERLEKRIRDLLYLTKLNYLSTKEQKRESFNLTELLEQRLERFQCRRPELIWTVKLVSFCTTGDREQWGVAIDNLLDNQIRYAVKRIVLSLDALADTTEKVLLRIWNDGNSIENELIDSLFEPYQIGQDGEFGLGLAIVKQITEFHGAKIWASNEVDNGEEGVAFYIKLCSPLSAPPSPM